MNETLEDFIKKDDVLKIVAKLHTQRAVLQDKNDDLSLKRWCLTNYASGYIMTELGLSYPELDMYKNRHKDQLEFNYK